MYGRAVISRLSLSSALVMMTDGISWTRLSAPPHRARSQVLSFCLSSRSS